MNDIRVPTVDFKFTVTMIHTLLSTTDATIEHASILPLAYIQSKQMTTRGTLTLLSISIRSLTI